MPNLLQFPEARRLDGQPSRAPWVLTLLACTVAIYASLQVAVVTRDLHAAAAECRRAKEELGQVDASLHAAQRAAADARKEAEANLRLTRGQLTGLALQTDNLKRELDAIEEKRGNR